MQQVNPPIVKDLVLIGGGHTHAIALRMFGMKPLPGVRITLITDTSHTPYSGMLPGHVAGFYSFDECHIDLRRLAGFAQAQLYLDSAVGLDVEHRKVFCANHPPVAFDYLSIDIGSTPAKTSVPGAAEYAIPAKPVSEFLSGWNQVVEDVTRYPEKPMTLCIVGGGAGGVELAMNMQRHLHQVLAHAQQPSDRIDIHLFHGSAELLTSHNRWVSQRLQAILTERNIRLHLQERVCEVLPDKVICESGLTVECDAIFWVTQASSPSWIKASGLATDSKGFVLVNDFLQSVSHPQVFATGDIATMQNHPRPKAGVFAVRQGKPLFENLRRMIERKPLKPYSPQKLYLSLIGTGDREAIASWGQFGWQSPWLWCWKDRIDRKFMQRFSDLPEMSVLKKAGGRGQRADGSIQKGIPAPPEWEPANNVHRGLDTLTPKSRGQRFSLASLLPPAFCLPPFFASEQEQLTTNTIMHCAGCGSKVASTTLERVLQRLQTESHLKGRTDILVGLETPDDAAIVQVPADRLMVHTIDYFRSLINDPFIFGQISTNHCLSDIFAMGATPQSALAVVTVPYAEEKQVEETLYQLLSGAAQVLQQAETPLVGGHTTEGAELAFGLSCNGLVHPDRILRKGGMKPDQVLILTKALGTGTLFAADMRHQAKGRWIDRAVESMLLSNQAAAQVFLDHGATACTDITGFGLLGHLVEMIQASGVAVELELEAIPILDGAIETVGKGIVSSLQPQNLRSSRLICNLSQVQNHSHYPLLFDPQTSGGLLASIPAEQAANCLAALKAFGYVRSCVIGHVMPRVEGVEPIAIA